MKEYASIKTMSQMVESDFKLNRYIRKTANFTVCGFLSRIIKSKHRKDILFGSETNNSRFFYTVFKNDKGGDAHYVVFHR